MDSDSFVQPQHPLLLVVSGPSGAGKDTIAMGLLDRHPSQFHFVVTATNRPPRIGEKHGVDYFFVSTAEFTRMIQHNELIEYALVYDTYKGVPKQQIWDALASGKDVVMRVDVQGAATIKQILPNATFVFICAESESALAKRLQSRRSESDVERALRIATAREEIAHADQFDYFIINYNGRQKETIDTLEAIVTAEKCRMNRTPISL